MYIVFQGQSGSWLLPILQDALRHVYQRSLLENKPELLDVIPMVRQSLHLILSANNILCVTIERSAISTASVSNYHNLYQPDQFSRIVWHSWDFIIQPICQRKNNTML